LGNEAFEFSATLSTEKSLLRNENIKHPNAIEIKTNCKAAAGLAIAINR
jgi:hypothetical protein